MPRHAMPLFVCCISFRNVLTVSFLLTFSSIQRQFFFHSQPSYGLTSNILHVAFSVFPSFSLHFVSFLTPGVRSGGGRGRRSNMERVELRGESVLVLKAGRHAMSHCLSVACIPFCFVVVLFFEWEVPPWNRITGNCTVSTCMLPPTSILSLLLLPPRPTPYPISLGQR